MDALTLEQLRKAGSDLNQPHHIDNFLYFPDEAAARTAADQLRGSSESIEVTQAANGPLWLTKAGVVAIPSAENIAQMRSRMEAIAGPLKGEYDGWGAPIVSG